jgi:hypothetical protein
MTDGPRTATCVVAGDSLGAVAEATCAGLVAGFDDDVDERSQETFKSTNADENRRTLIPAFQSPIGNRQSQISIQQV